MDEQNLETRLAEQSKAPRVTLQDVQDNIIGTWFFTAGDGAEQAVGVRPAGPSDSLNRLTFCVLVLKNGFTVTGQSACVSAENFDPKIGEEIAYKNAFEQIWPLMGYALADRLSGARAED
jgi:hypothetical protein